MQRNGYTLGYARSIRQPAGLVSGLLAFGILLSAQGVYSALPAYADPIFPPPAGTVQTPPEAANGLGSLQSIVPTRVRDTRDGIGGASGALGPGQGSVVAVAGVAGIPSTGVAGVAANVTVTEPTRPGYLTVYPSGVSRPLASNLNFDAGQTVPNLVVVKVGADGNIVVFNGSNGTVEFIVDVTGWYKAWIANTAPTVDDLL
ncbi:MAG: hypothetical protein E6I86_04935, partial [Chloroflexi bacterium]